jgi:hypothetical protein
LVDLGEEHRVDPDAQVGPPARGTYNRSNVLAAAWLCGVLTAGIALRVARFTAGDYYEDGASHWWAAATAAETGRLVDPFNLNHLGYWLPGYDVLAAALLIGAGSTDPVLLRSLSVASFVCATLALTALAWPAGRATALLAATLLTLSPFDILNSAMSTPVEPAVALLLFGLLIQQRSRAAKPSLLPGAAFVFSLAVLFRYEAIPFIGILLVHGWWWHSADALHRLQARVERPFLLVPIAVAFVFLLLTWGQNLPSQALSGPLPGYEHQMAIGHSSTDPTGRVFDFWRAWIPSVAAGFVLALVGVGTYFRRVESWLVIAFSILLSIFLFVGVGTASFRYLAPVEPLMWLLAGAAVVRLSRRVAAFAWRGGASAARNPRRFATAVALSAALILASAQASFITLEGSGRQVALNGPLDRAAAFLSTLPQDPSMLVIVDSPVAAEASGLPPSRMIGSLLLPDARGEALTWIEAHVQYILAVNLSEYKLLQLFPELALGLSDTNFSLLYNATGWEIQYSVKTAWVYQVNRGQGTMAATPDVGIAFPFHEENLTMGVRGMRLMYRGGDISSPALGVGYPTLMTSAGTFVPGRAQGAFKEGGPPNAVRAQYALYPRAAGGNLDVSATPVNVTAEWVMEGQEFRAIFEVTPPPAGLAFVLRVDNAAPANEFPLSFNDTIPAPTGAPHNESPVWSLRNWLIGTHAVLQFDFRAPSLLFGGRDPDAATWLAYQAPTNATALSYAFHVLTPGAPLFSPDEPSLLRDPLFRAGGYLATASLSPPHRILSEFAFGKYPWILQASGRPVADFTNSTEMPGTRTEALHWLREAVDFVVVVNRSNDTVTALFPELLSGDSTRDFSLLFDASGPPDSPTARLVWVYRVNRGDGVVAAHEGAALHFYFEQDQNTSFSLGLGLIVNGTELVHPAPGLGVPEAVVNGTPYRAGRASMDFLAGSSGRSVTGVFWLYPVPNGTMDRAAMPLVVRATYLYADLQLGVTLDATPAQPDDNVSLTAALTLPMATFPGFVNDSGPLNSSSSFDKARIWSLHNWLTGPLVAVQADFRDPYLLYLERSPSGTTSIFYEAPAGATQLQLSLWILKPEMVPQVR